jgi:hypothetical protein
MCQQSKLDAGEIDKLVCSLRSLETDHPELVDKLRLEADYFERNAARMRYPQFRRQHLFVGSGVIEAGCKTAIGSRLKHPACSGVCAVQTPSSLSGVTASAESLKITGRLAHEPLRFSQNCRAPGSEHWRTTPANMYARG